jgi:hypothetical protein
MKIFEEPIVEITRFTIEDVITESSGDDHDNGFVDIGDLLNALFNA